MWSSALTSIHPSPVSNTVVQVTPCVTWPVKWSKINTWILFGSRSGSDNLLFSLSVSQGKFMIWRPHSWVILIQIQFTLLRIFISHEASCLTGVKSLGLDIFPPRDTPEVLTSITSHQQSVQQAFWPLPCRNMIVTVSWIWGWLAPPWEAEFTRHQCRLQSNIFCSKLYSSILPPYTICSSCPWSLICCSFVSSPYTL